MADNVELDAGSGGAVVAADDITGVWYQISKLAFGPLDTATLVTASVGLPVDIKASISLDVSAATVTIAGTGTLVVQEDGAALTALELIDNIVLAEDAAHGSGDAGVMALAVRNDALAALAADGDYTPLQVDQLGALWVENSPNLVDSGNSRTATLTSGSTFTGTGVEVLEHAAITIQIDASHDSATDGMRFEFSTDNTNWDSSHLFTYTAADGSRNFQFASQARYFRVVYVNGGTGQSHFRLQTILHHTEVSTSIHRLVDDTSPDRSATIVKAAIIAQAAGSGDFVPVSATAGGNLKVAVEEFDASLAVTNIGTFAVQIVDPSFAVADGNALGEGVLIQGDDGTDRKNINVDPSTGDMQVDVTNTVAVDLGTDNDVTIAARAAGGCKMFDSIDLDETEEDVTSGPTTIYGIYVWNATAAPLWLQMFNTNTVTVGTTAPTNNFLIPANADSDGAGVVIPIPVAGLAYSTALTVAITTGSGTDNGAPGGGDAGIVVMYQD